MRQNICKSLTFKTKLSYNAIHIPKESINYPSLGIQKKSKFALLCFQLIEKEK